MKITTTQPCTGNRKYFAGEFQKLTGKAPTTKQVKEYFKKTKNYLFFARLQERCHGNSARFWATACERIKRDIEIQKMRDRLQISKSAQNKNLDILQQFLLNTGFLPIPPTNPDQNKHYPLFIKKGGDLDRYCNVSFKKDNSIEVVCNTSTLQGARSFPVSAEGVTGAKTTVLSAHNHLFLLH